MSRLHFKNKHSIPKRRRRRKKKNVTSQSFLDVHQQSRENSVLISTGCRNKSINATDGKCDRSAWDFTYHFSWLYRSQLNKFLGKIGHSHITQSHKYAPAQRKCFLLCISIRSIQIVSNTFRMSSKNLSNEWKSASDEDTNKYMKLIGALDPLAIVSQWCDYRKEI